MSNGRIILPHDRFQLTLERLSHQLVEEFDRFENTCLIGIQPRGTLLADRIYLRLLDILGVPELEYGKLDITFYRDDFEPAINP